MWHVWGIGEVRRGFFFVREFEGKRKLGKYNTRLEDLN
jgi:hypothetical protein